MIKQLKEKLRYRLLKRLKIKPIGVFVILRDDKGRCLMVRHNYGTEKYSLPGGKLEKGELYSEGGIREVLEETGLHIEITRLVGMFRLRLDEGDVILYEGRIFGGYGNMTLTSETSECKFFSLNEVKKLHSEGKVYNAQLSAILWSELPLRLDGLPHEGWLTIPPSPKP